MIQMNRRQALGSVALAALLPSVACTPPRRPAAIGAWGIDLTARDLSVAPGEDFFRYVNGTWLNNTEIPADRVSFGTFDMLYDKSETDLKAIFEGLAAGAPGSNEQKIADFYNAYLNQDAITALGLAPAEADLARIAAARTHEDLVRLIGAPDMPLASPIGIGVTLDERNPNRYIVGMNHGGLSLPDRDYYLRNDEQFRTIRTQFEAHVARMLGLAGQADGAAKARAILALETQIAERHWPIADRRQREAMYNLRDRAAVRALAPRFPWDAMLDSAELGAVTEIVIGELSAMGPLANLFLATPVATWQAYLTYHYLTNNSAVLPKPIDDENFTFYSAQLNGQPEQRERWKRGIASTNGALGKAVGQLYVARHFPPEAKAQMLELVENLRRAYGERIDSLTWMSAETKVVAREKLATFLPKIGYPDSWRDYSDFDVVAGDAFGNRKRSAVYVWRYDAARLSRPTDKTEWLYMDPQDVNAYYNPVFNEIVFPAAILQPPFFDPNADPAVNYGAIGGVIGHEMGHGFDDQGAKSDAQGVLRDWWTPADVAAFAQLTSALSTQYGAFEALPGLNVNGPLTLGENIGDNGGLQVAHYAYNLSLNGRPAPTLDETTGDQRFFMSWGQAWRDKTRDEALRNQVLADPHSPAKFRCNGTVRNMDAWYAAFDVQQGQALFLPEDQRIEIW